MSLRKTLCLMMKTPSYILRPTLSKWNISVEFLFPLLKESWTSFYTRAIEVATYNLITNNQIICGDFTWLPGINWEWMKVLRLYFPWFSPTLFSILFLLLSLWMYAMFQSMNILEPSTILLCLSLSHFVTLHTPFLSFMYSYFPKLTESST